jgi:hypothetical protein
MQDWHSTCLGRRTLPRDLSAFEIEAFFNFSDAERRVIEDRRGPALKLALALQIGFLRMTGRLLEAVRIVPPALWRHLGEQLGVAAPDLASLRSMYQRRRTLFEHQEVACETLGFHWLSEAQRRALVRVLRGELTRTSDRQRLLQFARRWLYEHRLIVLRDRDLRTMIIKAIREHEAGLGIELLTALGVDRHLTDLPDSIVRRYARRLAARAPAVAWPATRPSSTTRCRPSPTR